MNRTEEFLNNINTVMDKKAPDKVIDKLKILLLDYIGVTLAGASVQKKYVLRMLEAEGDSGTSAIIGMNVEHTLKNSIFYNGLSSHTLDFDDGVNKGIIHLGSPVFSALLPIMDRYNISGKKILKAAVIGYETSFTVAASIQPVHKQSGYHATGTCGTLGVAMAVAKALDFDCEQQKKAFSIAAVSASGTLKVLEDGSVLKPYNVAKTALMGYISAQMGRERFADPDDVLSGNNGFLCTMTNNAVVDLKSVLVNGTYAIEKAYIKPYAACRYCHPSIEAAMNLRNRIKIVPESIDKIEVRTYSLAVKKHDHTDIKGCNSAKMSIPYSVAIAYLTRKAGMDEYSDKWIRNKDILQLVKKVKVYEKAEFTEVFPDRTIAELKLVTKSGEEYVEFVEYPKGEPENPLTVDEVKDKFYALAQMSGKTKDELEDIVNVVFDFENRYGELYRLLK